MAEPRRGLLDTSVVIDLDRIDIDRLPEKSAVAASNGLPLYTRNPDDFSGLEELVSVKTL